jgi:hypothetical protein
MGIMKLFTLLSRLIVPAILIVLLACPALSANSADIPTVGIEGTKKFKLPGKPLKALPVNEKSLIILRIGKTFPHGTDTRYNVRYIGLLPGQYDLGDYLVQEDGSTVSNLPPLPVEIAPLLPVDHNGQLIEEPLQNIPFFSRFREIVMAVWILWALLLIPIILIKRKGMATAPVVEEIPEPTIAEKLQPLVVKAADGTISSDEQSHLELLLIAFWKHELQLDALSMSEALTRMKEHPAAGSLLREMEAWLYKPPANEMVDVATLLAPYRSLPADNPLSSVSAS